MVKLPSVINFIFIYLHALKKAIPYYVVTLYLAIAISTAIFTGCTETHRTPLPYTRDLQKGNDFYLVKKGDTLYSIGYRSKHGYKLLAIWNNIPPPYKLYVGRRIKLFSPKQKKTRKLSTQTIKNGSSSQKEIKSKRSLSQKKLILSNNKKTMLKLIWHWPIKGKILKDFSKYNKGLDIFGKPGQQIRSTAAGKVVYSGSGLTGYGNLLIIKHNQEFLSAYANNRILLVKEGQLVKKGQIIAEIGQAKNNKQSSLHFEIRKNGNPVNPLHYLPKK